MTPPQPAVRSRIRHHYRSIAGVEIFYREAGDPTAPTIVLLSGHPSGVHAYDGLIERLAGSWHVVAPDYPGYGFSATPADAPWTFDWLADVTNAFLRRVPLALRGMNSPACRHAAHQRAGSAGLGWSRSKQSSAQDL